MVLVSSTSLPIFYLVVLPIVQRRVLKSLNIIVGLPISHLSSISFCFTYFVTLLFGVYPFMIVLPSWEIDHFIMFCSVSDNLICSEVYFVWYYCSHYCFSLVNLAWFIFYHPFTFNLPLSLYLKWVSYRQHIVEWCFFPVLYQSLSFNCYI